MKGQINNGYAEQYYLTKEAIVYNAKTDNYLKPSDKHTYKLLTEQNKYKTVTQKDLYRLVYHDNFCVDNIEDLENEEWRYIQSTDKKYMISNRGRIKSFNGYEAAILTANITRKGYERIQLIIDGMKTSFLVHRLVAAAFLPKPKTIYDQIHHKDFNKLNNNSSNLEWLSIKEHATKHQKEKKIDDNIQQQSKSETYNNSKGTV